MTSVEGMWKFQTSSLEHPDALRWGGIVVLETGRVFGGDSVMAFLGAYEVDRKQISGRVRSWIWNHEWGDDGEEPTNVFGMGGDIDYIALLSGEIDGNVITGTISPEEYPQISLPCRMEKIADLP